MHQKVNSVAPHACNLTSVSNSRLLSPHCLGRCFFGECQRETDLKFSDVLWLKNQWSVTELFRQMSSLDGGCPHHSISEGKCGGTAGKARSIGSEGKRGPR